jgi:hypothetical protein
MSTLLESLFKFVLINISVVLEIWTVYGHFIGKNNTNFYDGSVLAFGTQVRGFKPGRNRRILQGEKNPQHALLGREIKACPMSQICGM